MAKKILKRQRQSFSEFPGTARFSLPAGRTDIRLARTAWTNTTVCWTKDRIGPYEIPPAGLWSTFLSGYRFASLCCSIPARFVAKAVNRRIHRSTRSTQAGIRPGLLLRDCANQGSRPPSLLSNAKALYHGKSPGPAGGTGAGAPDRARLAALFRQPLQPGATGLWPRHSHGLRRGRVSHSAYAAFADRPTRSLARRAGASIRKACAGRYRRASHIRAQAGAVSDQRGMDWRLFILCR